MKQFVALTANCLTVIEPTGKVFGMHELVIVYSEPDYELVPDSDALSVKDVTGTYRLVCTTKHARSIGEALLNIAKEGEEKAKTADIRLGNAPPEAAEDTEGECTK